jgi:glucosamine--fructose-6-phosphate aminotransferase (isomerizing)
MCGIVGCIGDKNAIKPVINGLKNLEYRGYDSAGIAFLGNEKKIKCVKRVGRVESLQNKLDAKHKSQLAIGHTRWATHGVPTIVNAHPHYNTDKTIFVITNGIIENHDDIRKFLTKQGYTFNTQTDSEVIPQLIDYHYKKSKNIQNAFKLAIKELKGAFAIVMASEYTPNKLFAAKISSPLAIGLGKNIIMLGSDASAICDYTKKIIYLDDYEIAEISLKNYKITNFKNGIDIKKGPVLIDINALGTDLGKYKHYMQKEIFEAPKTVQSAITGRVQLDTNSIKLGGLEIVEEHLQDIERILIVACGTSYYAGLVGEYLIEEIANIPVEVQQASEFKYKNEPITSKTVMLAISQSGETADTIAALKKVEGKGILRLGIVNTPGSTIARMTDAGVYWPRGT